MIKKELKNEISKLLKDYDNSQDLDIDAQISFLEDALYLLSEVKDYL